MAVVQVKRTTELRAQGPVWAIALDGTGRVYLGADQVLVLDSGRVHRIEVPGGRQIRALAAKDGRIWVGAADNLGYLAQDPTGGMQFISLQAQLPRAGSPPGEIWHVHPTPDGAVFVAAQVVMRWDGVRFTTWSLPCTQRLLAFSMGDELWLYQDGVGLLQMEDTGPLLIWPERELPGAVLWAVGGAQGRLLIGTIEGAFRRSGATWTKLPNASAALAGKLAIGAVQLGNDEIAVGTFLNGVVLFSPGEDRVVATIDRKSGLKDDSIHTLRANQDHTLWVGTAGGWARIVQPGRMAVLDERTGLEGGPVLASLSLPDGVVVVTDRAALRIEKNQLASLPPVEGLLRDATVQGDTIWVGGYGGLWRHDPRSGWEHEHYVSAEVHKLTASHRKAEWLWFVEGFAPKALVNTERGWATRSFGVNLRGAPSDLFEDAAGDLWVVTPASGVWRMRLEEAEGRTPELKVVTFDRDGAGLPRAMEASRLAPVGDRLFLFAKQGILAPMTSRRGFAPAEAFRGLVGIAATKDPRRPSYWAVERSDPSDGRVALVRVTGDGTRFDPVALDGIETVGQVTRLDWVGDELWIGGTLGVLRTGAAALARMANPPRVQLRAVTMSRPQVEDEEGAAVRLQLAGDLPRLPTGVAGLRFEWSGESDALYQTALARNGTEAAWTPPGRAAERDFSGLAPGAYRFQVRAVDRWGRMSEPAGYAFFVLPPWWATRYAYAGFALAGVGLVVGYLRWRIRRLRRQNERLNRLVEERTRELAMANTAKSEFLANISHEIRNPLNGIVGLVNILGRAKLPGEEKELARSLGACVRSLTRVFDEVLGFSKLEYGQVKVQPRTFLVGAVLDEVARVFATTAEQRGNKVKVVLPEADRALVGDEEKIKTIAGNFLGNALKYAPGSVVEIGATLERNEAEEESDGTEPAGFTLCLFVTDHGPGIPADEQELIFRKFVRGHAAEVRREPGAGLGLATCRALAELMGGGVSVESPAVRLANGQRGGATFYLHLQLRAADAGAVKKSVPGMGEPGEEAWLGKESGRALIVEDQEYNQIVIRRLTQRLGFMPVVAPDATSALARLGEAPFEVIFLDWDLPGMTGSDLARRIRTTERGQEAILFAATAHDSDEIRGKCRDAGMDGFLLKPFDEAIVAAALAEVRQRRKAQAGTSGELNLGMFRYVAYDDPVKSAQAVAQYLELLGQNLADLERCIQQGDRRQIAHFAHRLLAHANVIRAKELGAAAHALEVQAATAGPMELTALQAEVANLAGVLRTRIEAFRRSSGESA